MLLDLIKKSPAPKESCSSSQPQAAPSPIAQRPAPPPAQPAEPQPVSGRSPNTPIANVLGSDVQIEGTITFSRDLLIDGRVEGKIQAAGTLTVGEHASFKGEIKTRAVVIFGSVEGNVVVDERCELRSTAIVIGDISAGSLTIEEGAAFTGQSKVGKPQNVIAATPAAAETRIKEPQPAMEWEKTQLAA